MATIVEFEGKTPQIHDSVFVAATAMIIGDVVLEEGASVWYGAVIPVLFALASKPTFKTMPSFMRTRSTELS